MQGSIRRRGDAWELRVYAGTDTVTGKRRYATRTVRGGKREAQRALAEFVVDAQRGRLSRTTATVAELLEAWFDQARDDFSPKTVLETRGVLDRYLLPDLGAVRLNKLKTADIDRYYSRLVRSGGRSQAGLAPATVRRIHGILRRSLAQGVRWSWIGFNPAAETTPPRVSASDLHPPTPAQVKGLLASVEVDDPELAMFLQLSAGSGARRSELLALRWSDIDFVTETMTIRRGVVLGPSGLVEKDTKTHQVRRVALDHRTAERLRTHQQAVRARAAQCGVRLDANTLVFAADVEMVTPWFPDSVSRRFRHACQRAGIKGVRLHDLRHYVATQLLSSGVDVRTVAGRLGHRNAATTLNVYSHFVPETDRRAADIMSELHAPSPVVAGAELP